MVIEILHVAFGLTLLTFAAAVPGDRATTFLILARRLSQSGTQVFLRLDN
jgi:hypothetical protein